MPFRRSFAVNVFLLSLLISSCSRPAENTSIEEESLPGTPTPSVAVAPRADAATLIGSVIADGNPPPAAPIRISGDPACELHGRTTVPATDLVRNASGQLANVFVYVKDYKGPASPSPAPALLDQKECMYEPHVTGVQTGQILKIRNSDSTLHNVHAMAKTNDAFNVGQPVKGMVTEKTFDRPEVMIRFKCDVHSWMSSYVGVLDHPFFAVSKPDGSFSIPNLPPGTYTIEAWHERLGSQTQRVTVAARESKQVSFRYKAS